jgi:hypothetical protein
LAAVRTPATRSEEKGKWGFIDKTGSLVIPPLFDDVWKFSNGRARVKVGGSELRVDKKGNLYYLDGRPVDKSTVLPQDF